MNALVEYYPNGVCGLHWEASAVDERDEVRGVVLAEADDGWVALGHIEERRSVLFLRPAELVRLRDALVGGEFDHLMSGGRVGLRRPTVERGFESPSKRAWGRWYRRLWRAGTGRVRRFAADGR
ncbi:MULTISPECIES: hypothetical protein [Kitasatospora]|uniref:Uncharacterized protein n=1 Tax=Kitasatospora setae (strain ATCC 33774 / DSM 43861 / JCM 3304 / KCC A-0304 / NBRC 14216 / KM-6054) TaxID=452652 RepID=E4N2I4_KITSK|nr:MULTISPECIES: hypothetical protein [Kitasatospora]BAJ32368.1 hypothetical protein KSE_66090 [Kitasatospora setae KM-6054]